MVRKSQEILLVVTLIKKKRIIRRAQRTFVGKTCQMNTLWPLGLFMATKCWFKCSVHPLMCYNPCMNEFDYRCNIILIHNFLRFIGDLWSINAINCLSE